MDMALASWNERRLWQLRRLFVNHHQFTHLKPVPSALDFLLMLKAGTERDFLGFAGEHE